MTIRHNIRAGKLDKTQVVELTARKAIIYFCIECMGFQAIEVRDCTDPLCPLYPYRTRDKPESTAESVL